MNDYGTLKADADGAAKKVKVMVGTYRAYPDQPETFVRDVVGGAIKQVGVAKFRFDMVCKVAVTPQDNTYATKADFEAWRSALTTSGLNMTWVDFDSASFNVFLIGAVIPEFQSPIPKEYYIPITLVER